MGFYHTKAKALIATLQTIELYTDASFYRIRIIKIKFLIICVIHLNGEVDKCFNHFIIGHSWAIVTSSRQTGKMRVHLLLAMVNPQMLIVLKTMSNNKSLDLANFSHNRFQHFFYLDILLPVQIQATTCDFYKLFSAPPVPISQVILQVYATLINTDNH